MKHELSILIPVYNEVCASLVAELQRQAEAIEGLLYEIIVADDGSTYKDCIEANQKAFGSLPHCQYIIRRKNVGRAAIRNFLAKESHYQWLLFLDCDMQVPNSRFLQYYLESDGQEIIDGGFKVFKNDALEGTNLRYTYEWFAQPHHSVEQRRNNPHRSFRTTNFMVRRDIMLNNPFDERFLHYGYEDVLFGKTLKHHNIGIEHINNAMMLADVEPNAVFVSKTEEALRTLYQFRNELRGYSRLLTLVDGIHIGLVKSAIRLWHRLFGALERRMLCGNKPNLTVFKLYKVGYYLSLTKID